MNDIPSSCSKEPRPVYSPELDLLGFNEFWQYEKQDKVPYMWAEANTYWYRGQKVAKITGGSLCDKPQIILEEDVDKNEILPRGSILKEIDIASMIEKNSYLLDVLQKIAETKIVNYYTKYRNKVDCFYVAFSGGKDSMVLLDIVKLAMPPKSFIVLFGDTGMEFPDTYRFIKNVEKTCKGENISFYRAKSHLTPIETWQMFGPPAKTLRWCCSVHKSTPQTLKLREITHNKAAIGFAFVGVRAYESATRYDYAIFNYGAKQKCQYSLHPILEWSAAEVWLYTYYKELTINLAYKKGNSRVGCLCCPMSTGGNSIWFRKHNYSRQFDRYIKIIKECLYKEHDQGDYIKDSQWAHRYSGKEMVLLDKRHEEYFSSDLYRITMKPLHYMSKEWFKTIPDVPFKYKFIIDKDCIDIELPLTFYRTAWTKLIRNISIKATYCCACRVCEANCPHGAITFKNGSLSIEGCKKCGLCQVLDNGCLYYRCIRQPKREKNKMNINSLESYDITKLWFSEFFKNGDAYFENSGLGPNQKKIFKRFLKTALLLENRTNQVTSFFDIVNTIGSSSLNSWGLILINLAHNNPQIKWYIKQIPLDVKLSFSALEALLKSDNVPDKAVKDIRNAFIKLCNAQFGYILHFGSYTTDDSKITLLKRTKPIPPDPRVFLYGLYKFAEACDGFYELTLGRLMDFEVASAGVSPAEIFGLSRNETQQYLHGLAQNYQDFVLSFTTTHGLELLNLNPDKNSNDVLTLF